MPVQKWFWHEDQELRFQHTGNRYDANDRRRFQLLTFFMMISNFEQTEPMNE